jgi:hypothetical protein
MAQVSGILPISSAFQRGAHIVHAWRRERKTLRYLTPFRRICSPCLSWSYEMRIEEGFSHGLWSWLQKYTRNQYNLLIKNTLVKEVAKFTPKIAYKRTPRFTLPYTHRAPRNAPTHVLAWFSTRPAYGTKPLILPEFRGK